MATRTLVCFVIFLAVGNLSNGFIFKGWGGSSQSNEGAGTFEQPTSFNQRTGQPSAIPERSGPVPLPCNGSPEITQACDTFCKSIRMEVGNCVKADLTCRCTGTLTSISIPVSLRTPPSPSSNGIRVLPSPNLSKPQNESSTVVNPALDAIARKRRSRRQSPVIQASGPKDPANLCAAGSCRQKCTSQGYGTCSAECVGLSCYCRCSGVNKRASSP